MNKSKSKYFNTAVKMDLALISLLKKKPFEYITISELCKKAEVNRSTFYLHYENIGDLLEETARYLIDDFTSYFSVNRNDLSFDFSSCEMDNLNFISDKYLVPYLTYIRDNKEVFVTVVLNGKSFGLDDMYQRMFENIFNPILERFNYPQEDRKYVMMYYLSGINAISTEWLEDGCKKPIPEISRIIKECVFGLNNILIHDRQKNPSY